MIEEFVCNATYIYYYRTPQQNRMSNMALPCLLKDNDCTPDSPYTQSEDSLLDRKRTLAQDNVLLHG